MLKSYLTFASHDSPAQSARGEEEAAADEAGSERAPPPPARAGRPLHRAEVSVRLSMLGKTADGDGYTYLKAACTDMGLVDIGALTHFRHLQHVDVSANRLTETELRCLARLPYLLSLRADRNLLRSAALPSMKYLQVVVMNHNAITSVADVYQQELSTLEIAHNGLDKLELAPRLSRLRCIDFRNNMLKELRGLAFAMLDSVYLANNRIKAISLEGLPSVRVLHLRNNPIRNLNGFFEGNRKLNYVNLRYCQVSSVKQIRKLSVLPALETIVVSGCPYTGGPGREPEGGKDGDEDDPALRAEVLAALPRLKRINKTPVTDEERTEAKEVMMQWYSGAGDAEEQEEEINAEEEEKEDEDNQN